MSENNIYSPELKSLNITPGKYNFSVAGCNILSWIFILKGFPSGSDDKESTCNEGGLSSIPRVEKIPWRREWLSIPVFFFFFFSFFLFKNLFYWRIVDWKYCVNFYCTAKWLSYTFIYIVFHILFNYGLSQDIEYNSLCYTVGPCLSILYIIACIC